MAGKTINIEEQYRKSGDDRYYRNTMAEITGRLQAIAMSPEFQLALDGKSIEEEAEKKEAAEREQKLSWTGSMKCVPKRTRIMIPSVCRDTEQQNFPGIPTPST